MARRIALDGGVESGSHSPSAAPATPDIFSKPRPRPPRSPSQSARIRVQNRRRAYLDTNPDYFIMADQELADPDLYDRLVRQFLSPAEREAEGRSKGWGKTLESSLMRGEARLGQLASSATSATDDNVKTLAPSTARTADCSTSQIASTVAGLVDDKPATREEGFSLWNEFLRERFVRGGDEDFEYGKVDENEDLDFMEHMDREEAYFDAEEPEWADDSELDEHHTDSTTEDGHLAEDRETPKRERILVGQTGIQDF